MLRRACSFPSVSILLPSDARPGKNFYCNFGCVILDCARVQIGDNSLFGPHVQLYPATHPTDPEVRLSGKELAFPIIIGNNVWIGGGAIVCPGVTIGDHVTIGARSVVTKDVPPRCVAAGNPCRVIRHLPPPPPPSGPPQQEQ